MTDEPEEIRAKLAKVPTDSGTLGGSIPQKGGVANLFTLAYLFGGKELHHKYVEDYKEKKIRYGEMKQELSGIISTSLAPIREKRRELEAEPEKVDEILREHAQRCREIAQGTIKEVKEKMGFFTI